MDGLTLLAEARAAGLTVTAIGGRLVIRGPRLAEAIARRLLQHKVEIMEALATGTNQNKSPKPDLSTILPPVTWLTPPQHRLWRERARAYVTEGMSRNVAETEAMAELICTGRLYNPERSIPWPRLHGAHSQRSRP